MNTTEQIENETTPYNISMKTLSIGQDYFKLIVRMIFVEIMKILNYFLETVKDELATFAPSVDEASSVQATNMGLLKTIEMISESPEFQEKWREFAENIASLLKILLEKIKITTGNEFNEILEQMTELIEKNAKNAVFGAGAGALRGICAMPPVVPFCMAASVASTSANVGGETIITMLNSVSKMADAFSQVFGDTAMPFAETIKKARDFFDYIESMKEKVQQNIQNISNKADEMVSNVQNISNKANEVVSNVQSNVQNIQ